MLRLNKTGKRFYAIAILCCYFVSGFLVGKGSISVYAAEETIAEEKKEYKLSFDSDGGSVISEVYTIVNGQQYGKLPTPSKLGYKFLGWYTSKAGGKLVQWSDIVDLTTDQILYAKWEGDIYYVRFDPQGGKVEQEGKNCFYGAVYGTFPKINKSDDIFLGWYTEKGELVTENTICNTPGNHTLYARWKNDIKSVDISELTFSFANTKDAFRYEGDEKLPLYAYQYVFGDSFLAESLYEQGEKWAGNSFGMAVLSVMLYKKDVNLNLRDFNTNYNLTRELSLNDYNSVYGLSVKSLIESLQVMEKGIVIQEAYNENLNQLQNLYYEVEKVENGEREPVIIQMRGSQGGHTVVGYAVQGDKLQIYDPDYPNTTRYITVEKDDIGTLIGWSYTLREGYKWESKQSDCSIRYIGYNTCKQIWEERNKNTERTGQIISINSKNAIVKDFQNEIVAVLVDGKIDSRMQDVYLIAESSLDVNSQYIYFHVPEGMYALENLENSEGEFFVRIMSEKQGSFIQTTAKKVILELKDEEKVNGVIIESPKNKSYKIEMRSGIVGEHQKLEVSGVGTEAESLSICQQQGKIEIANMDVNVVTVDGNARKTYLLSMLNSDGGKIYLNGRYKQSTGNQKIVAGEQIDIIMKPDTGYYLANVIWNGTEIGNLEDGLFIKKVKCPYAVTAIFNEIIDEDVEINDIPIQKYTGTNITPSVTVEIGDVTLRKNVDYQLLYTNNVNVGIAKVEIVGMGQFQSIYMEKKFIIALEEGMKYVKGNIKYKVLSISNSSKTGTVMIEDYVDTNKMISLLDTISIGNYKMKITKIAQSAFQGCKKIKGNIKIGKYVKEIGASAFYECTGLKQVTIGASVEKIGESAFMECKNLQKVIFSTNKLKKIEAEAFYGNKKGRRFTYPKNKKAEYQKLVKKS